MAKSDWRFQSEFEKLRLRAARYGVDHKDAMTDELPLIQWKGSTEAVKRLGDPQKQPPDDIDNPARARRDEEFLCWLMLPKSFSSKVWYFGRVFSQRKSLPDALRLFQDIAAEAGSLLRQDKLFREYLAPCVKHSELAVRFPQFQTNLDITTWCALLFAQPEFKHPIQFPYEKTIAGKEIGEASIVNPFMRTAEVIKYWRLNSTTPMPATGRVAGPYEWQNQIHTRSAPQDQNSATNSIWSPWIVSPELIGIMKSNGISAANKRGYSDRTITRVKKTWGAEPQAGSHNRRFRFKLSQLREIGVNYPTEWNHPAT